MRIKTAIVLMLALTNTLWLAHVFALLALTGYYPIREPSPWIACGELALCLIVAGYTVERLIRLKESKE